MFQAKTILVKRQLKKTNKRKIGDLDDNLRNSNLKNFITPALAIWKKVYNELPQSDIYGMVPFWFENKNTALIYYHVYSTEAG